MKRKGKKHVLNSLGYADERSYLRSKTWLSAAKKVLDRVNGRCEVCGNPAERVFIKKWTKSVLTGTTAKHTVACCCSCYDKASVPLKNGKINDQLIGKRLSDMAIANSRIIFGLRVRRHNIVKSYGQRNTVLAELGYSSYAEYQASSLWADIRTRVAKLYGTTCRLCDNPAVAFHHQSYDPDVLDGTHIDQIYPVCTDCHKKIEFDGTRKRHFQDVKRTFRRLQEAARRKRGTG